MSATEQLRRHLTDRVTGDIPPDLSLQEPILQALAVRVINNYDHLVVAAAHLRNAIVDGEDLTEALKHLEPLLPETPHPEDAGQSFHIVEEHPPADEGGLERFEVAAVDPSDVNFDASDLPFGEEGEEFSRL